MELLKLEKDKLFPHLDSQVQLPKLASDPQKKKEKLRSFEAKSRISDFTFFLKVTQKIKIIAVLKR